MISLLDKFNISKYEQEAEEDIEMIEEKESYTNNTILKTKEKIEENQLLIEQNLNEKYNFKIEEINNSEIEFSKDKKKLEYKALTTIIDIFLVKIIIKNQKIINLKKCVRQK